MAPLLGGAEGYASSTGRLSRNFTARHSVEMEPTDDLIVELDRLMNS